MRTAPSHLTPVQVWLYQCGMEGWRNVVDNVDRYMHECVEDLPGECPGVPTDDDYDEAYQAICETVAALKGA